MKDPIIGRVPFTDGIDRDVYQAGDGRQYVVDTAGLPVLGVWILVEDGETEPPVIAAAG
jgi:hypothetical protein